MRTKETPGGRGTAAEGDEGRRKNGRRERRPKVMREAIAKGFGEDTPQGDQEARTICSRGLVGWKSTKRWLRKHEKMYREADPEKTAELQRQAWAAERDPRCTTGFQAPKTPIQRAKWDQPFVDSYRQAQAVAWEGVQEKDRLTPGPGR